MRQCDERANLLSVENVNGDMVSYTYDEHGNRISMTYPGGRVVSCVCGRMNRVTPGPDGEAIAYAYGAAGRRTETSGGASATSYRYDSVGNLVKQVTHGESEIAFGLRMYKKRPGYRRHNRMGQSAQGAACRDTNPPVREQQNALHTRE